MELATQGDWQAAEQRVTAWWQGEVIDRPVIEVTVPRAGETWERLAYVVSPAGIPGRDQVSATADRHPVDSGRGAGPTSAWLPPLRRIQMMITSADTEAQARETLHQVPRWIKCRSWVVA